MLAIQKKISNYNFSNRNGNKVQYIVMHYTGNNGDTALNNAKHFSNGNKGASAHYFVDDKEIWQSVEETNASWHCGDGYGKYGITNSNSIGIEMCCGENGEISAKTEQNALELAKYLLNKYGLGTDRCVRHYDASRKVCPNWSANNWSRWNNFKAKLNGQAVSDVVVSSQPSNIEKAKNFVGSRCKELQEKLIKCGYNVGSTGADGIFGQATYNALVKFQQENGLDADGLAGNATFKKLDEVIARGNVSTGYSKRDFIREVQVSIGAAADGIAGQETLSKTVTLSKTKNIRHGAVKPVQKYLNSIGFNCGVADGIAGQQFHNAVVSYQKANGLYADGEITAKNITWKRLLGLA